MRADRPIRLNVSGVWYYMTCQGKLSKQCSEQPLIATSNDINKTIILACDKSVYSVERQLTYGYLTLEDGCRIGVCGKASCNEYGQVVCFSQYSSLCIRVAHAVHCSDNVIQDSMLNSNILIVGSPSAGKTTFLRDIASRASKLYNVVVVDERGELGATETENLQDADIITNCNKEYAFSVAIRSLAPDIIAMDELQNSDFAPLNMVMQSGVKVFATLHGSNIGDVSRLSSCGAKFDYYVILDKTQSKLPLLYSKSDVDKLL